MEERRAVICLPTYDERENLAPIVQAIRAVVPRVDVLVIDDASPDGTGELADALAAREAQLAGLREVRASLGEPGAPRRVAEEVARAMG